VLHTFLRSRLGTTKRAIATANGPSRSARGQTLVEFALVLPMLLVLLLGVADFGRVFSSGIALEAAARNGAEAAAQEYVQLLRNRTDPLTSPDYDRLHRIAIEEICGEAALLPSQAVSGTGDCADISEDVATTLTMPAVAVCIHDGADPFCVDAQVTSAPAECSRMHSTTWSPAVAGYDPPDPTLGPLPYVEVQLCYRFTTLMNADVDLPFGWGISLGDLWMERTREFVVACYQQASGPCN
jgi:Flp pilus assembly protein TadG